MASLDSLPPDQRAVLQLVLQRGRSYDEIAQLLSIDRAALRQRALAAFDALGPQTRVAPERRALITDYLLGQLPERVGEEMRDRLAESASERAWARGLASELAPLASNRLPEIPVDGAVVSEDPDETLTPEPEPVPEAQEGARAIPPDHGVGEPRPPRPRRSSRPGGAVLIALGVLVVVVVVVVVAKSGSSSTSASSSTSSSSTSSTPAASTSTSTPTTSTAAQAVAQINLLSPTGSTQTTGIAEVLRQGTGNGIAIVAQGVTPNTKHDAYAAWLYNSASDAKILGFVSPGVGANGRLRTAPEPLPANAAHYKQLLVTLETQANPHAPGKIILQGNLTLG